MIKSKKWIKELWPVLVVVGIGCGLWLLKSKTEFIPELIPHDPEEDALRYASDLAVDYSQSLVSLATVGIGGNGLLIFNEQYRRSKLRIFLSVVSFLALLLSLFSSTVLYDLAVRMAKVYSEPVQAPTFLIALQWQYRLLFLGILCLIMNLVTVVLRR